MKVWGMLHCKEASACALQSNTRTAARKHHLMAAQLWEHDEELRSGNGLQIPDTVSIPRSQGKQRICYIPSLCLLCCLAQPQPRPLHAPGWQKCCRGVAGGNVALSRGLGDRPSYGPSHPGLTTAKQKPACFRFAIKIWRLLGVSWSMRGLFTQRWETKPKEIRLLIPVQKI